MAGITIENILAIGGALVAVAFAFSRLQAEVKGMKELFTSHMKGLKDDIEDMKSRFMGLEGALAEQRSLIDADMQRSVKALATADAAHLRLDKNGFLTQK